MKSDSTQETVMRLRTEHQLLQCKKSAGTLSKIPDQMLRGHIQPDNRHKLVYCGIEKAGSTFWRRFLQCLNNRRVQSPYQIKPERVAENHTDIQNIKLVRILETLQSYTKFTFVRNPYTRLLSGYVDKIYSPNPVYWRIGSKAIRVARGIKFHCGHDVTFKEFVEYLIQTQYYYLDRDEHFIPGHDLCIPCQVHYDFIGKMETFANDTFHILEKLNLTQYLPHLQNFQKQSALDAIYDASQAYIAFRDKASLCLKYDQSLKRVWRKLQIRGLISDEIKYPFSQFDSKHIKQKPLFGLLKRAHKQSQKYDLKTQKRNYLINAYNMIPVQTMYRLANMFKLDFQIFDYEPFPDYLFQNRTTSNSNNVFSIVNL